MRKLVLILIAFFAVVVFIQVFADSRTDTASVSAEHIESAN